jgi:hypothetical protein
MSRTADACEVFHFVLCYVWSSGFDRETYRDRSPPTSTKCVLEQARAPCKAQAFEGPPRATPARESRVRSGTRMNQTVSSRAKRTSANRVVRLLFALGLVLVLGVGGMLWYMGTQGPRTSGPSATSAGSASVRLAWDRSRSPKVVGYWILFGTESGKYTRSVEVGDVTTATLSGLETGAKYYVVAVAFDADGNRSLPSNELVVVP